MKKPKMKLDSDGLKGILVQHVEKILFGVAIFVVVLFIYLGYRLDSLPESESPPNLQQLAANAVKHVEMPTAKVLEKKRMPRDGRGGQYEVRVRQASASTDASVYALNVPFDPPGGKPGSKREDPEVFAPVKLETAALTGALCLSAGEDMENPIADLENSPAPDKPKPKRKKRRRSGGAYGSGGEFGDGEGYGDEGSGESPYGDEGFGSGGAPGMGGLPPMGDNGSSGRRNRGSRKKKDEPIGPERMYPADKVCGYRPSGVSMGGMPGGDMPGSGMPGMPGSGMPGLGEPSAGGTGSGSVPPGMPPMGGGDFGEGGYAGSGASSGPGFALAGGTPVARTADVIIVKALAPFRKQTDEFKRVLGEAIGYDPGRDRPRFIFFQAQRADVTKDPSQEPAEKDWVSIMNPKRAKSIAENKKRKWHGVLPEVADPSYVDPNITMPAPPIMLRCLEDMLVHSEVPRRQLAPKPETPAPGEDEEGEPAEDDPGANLPGGLAGAGSGGYPGGYEGGMGYPGPGGMGGSGASGFYGGSGYPGSGGSMPDEGFGDEGYGMGDDFGGGYPGSYSATAEAVQYKLVRFFDMNVQRGHVYRYRIRLFVEDPNNPNTDPRNGAVSIPPPRRTLSKSVLERLNKQQADEATKKAYYVISDWSEPTAPVSLPSTSRLFVSAVEPARMATGIGQAKIQQSEPRGTVVPIAWDAALALDVSTETRAVRGAVMASKKQFDVLDPLTLVIKQLKDYDMRNNFMIVDMEGGIPLPGDRESRVKSAGEYAIIDDEGNFVVRNELDDYLKFRRYTFADEIKRGGSSMMGGEGDYGSGGFGPPGFGSGGEPGMGGPGELPDF